MPAKIEGDTWTKRSPKKMYYRVSDAVSILQCTPSSIYMWIKARALPAVKAEFRVGSFSRQNIVPHDKFVEWMDNQRMMGRKCATKFAELTEDGWVGVIPVAEFYTMREAAWILDISQTCLYRKCQTQHLKISRGYVGASKRLQQFISHEQVVKYFADRELFRMLDSGEAVDVRIIS